MSAFAAEPEIDRLSSNAANAQHSTGPKTQEGKDRSKFNAIKTGLFARTVLLPDEDQPAYDAIGARLESEWQPRTQAERDLVLTIQNTTWRLNRVVELEFSLYAVETEKHLDAIDAHFGEQPAAARAALARAAAYLANLKAFEQISRQEGRLQRALDRAHREIRQLVLHRLPTETIPMQPQTAAPAAAAQPSGFVPSKYPSDMPDFSGQPHMNEKRRRWLRQNGYKDLN